MRTAFNMAPGTRDTKEIPSVSSSVRPSLAAVCALLFALSIFRLIMSIVLKARGEDPADYMADPPTSIGGTVLLGIACVLLRRDIR